MHHLYAFCFLLSFSAATAQPVFSWAKGMGGTIWDRGNAIALDASGNVYTAGEFAGTVDSDPGPGVHNLTCTSTSCDIFISKLDANGNFLWAKAIGGTRYNAAYAIAVDAQNNV